MDRVDFHLLDSSESEDEMMVRVVRPIIRPRNNLLSKLNDKEFKNRFRMNKHSFRHLVNLLEGIEDDPRTKLNNPISKDNQVLIALRFYATGSFQINIGDHFNVSQPSVSRIVSNVTKHIASLRPIFINMPQTDIEKQQVALPFFELAGLPRVIGKCVFEKSL